MADEFELRDFLPYLLNQAAEEVSAGFQQHYKARYGMLRTEWRVLFHLGRYGAMTATEIVERARSHKTKVSRAVAALEARRFLERDVVGSDRRQEMLRLTRAGRAAFADLARLAQEHDRQLTESFTADEAEVLRTCLRRLAGFDSVDDHSP